MSEGVPRSDELAVSDRAVVSDQVPASDRAVVSDEVPVSDRVAELLVAVRRRIRAAWLLAAAERWVPIAAGIGLVMVLLARVVPWAWLEPAALLVGAGTLVALIARCVTLPVRMEDAARSADRGLATNDALSTSLQFSGLVGVFGDEIQARADLAARRGDVRAAVPLRIRWRPWAAAAAATMAALCVAYFTSPATQTASTGDIERAGLAAEADALRTRAEELSGNPLASPDQATLAEQLEQLAAQLERAVDLDTGLAALEQARSEVEASITDQFLAEKSAVQGLNRSLEARPLAEGAGAASQLEALGDVLGGLSAQDRAALAERLEALAATQTAGNPAAAGVLGAAAAALASGDLDGAAAALEAAASAQRAGEASLSDQTARANAADLLSDAAARLSNTGSRDQGQGTGQGQGEGQGQGQGQGEGQGTGQGQGRGQGSGSPSGSVTGASGGTGQGQGGQGTASGRGDSTETGGSAAPTVWLPGGASDEQRVGGISTSGEFETIGQGQAITGSSGARVPVDEVLSDYFDEAVESLDRGQIPPASRALVQRYFDAIAGF